MSDNFKKGIIAFLILLLLGIIYYSYNKNKEHAAIESKMQKEKDKLFDDLTKMEIQYDVAISQNTELSEELKIQKENVRSFKDSLRSVKKTNWKLINFYKNKIKNLNLISTKLVKMNDSLITRNNLLNIENQDLSMQKDSLATNLNAQTLFNDTLVKQNLKLAKKVALGEVVKPSNFVVTTYKERTGGKYKETDKARRVNVFKTSFVLNENPIADNKDIVSHTVILKPDGNILVNKGVFTTTNGERVNYSDKTTIPYNKSSISCDLLTKFGDVSLVKGEYTIDFYVEKKKAGTVKKYLR